MNISVVIPTINRVDLLKECLEPLVRNREVFQHILIVDNGKQDISDLPNIHTNSILLTTTSRNLGAGGSFNLGFNVMKREADWVLLLNDDIVLSDETVVALPALLEKYADKEKIKVIPNGMDSIFYKKIKNNQFKKKIISQKRN